MFGLEWRLCRDATATRVNKSERSVEEVCIGTEEVERINSNFFEIPFEASLERAERRLIRFIR